VTFVGDIVDGDSEINPTLDAMNIGHRAAAKILSSHLQSAARASHQCQQICVRPLLPGPFQSLAGVGASGIGANVLRKGCRLQSKKNGDSENGSTDGHKRQFKLRSLSSGRCRLKKEGWAV
jgi:hypothetical protein